MRISNSIGTRLLPRTRFVRPDADSVFSAASFSPPSASRDAASICSALFTASALGGGGRGRFRRRSLRTCRGLPLRDDRRAEHYEPGSRGTSRGQTP